MSVQVPTLHSTVVRACPLNTQTHALTQHSQGDRSPSLPTLAAINRTGTGMPVTHDPWAFSPSSPKASS